MFVSGFPKYGRLETSQVIQIDMKVQIIGRYGGGFKGELDRGMEIVTKVHEGLEGFLVTSPNEEDIIYETSPEEDGLEEILGEFRF